MLLSLKGQVTTVSLRHPIVLVVYTQHQLQSCPPSLQTVWLVSIAISIAVAVSIAIAAVTAAADVIISSTASYSL
jgi:hypothetical protein